MVDQLIAGDLTLSVNAYSFENRIPLLSILCFTSIGQFKYIQSDSVSLFKIILSSIICFLNLLSILHKFYFNVFKTLIK